MKCTSCDKKAVYHRKHEGRAFCGKHFTADIGKKVSRTIRDNDMIEKGDRICIALSGGKDSSLTLEILADIVGDWYGVKLFALAIDEGIEGYRAESLDLAEELCEEHDVELKVVSYQDAIGKSLDDILAAKKDARACTYCGVFRRTLLNRHAREMGATKVATGHNLDDELQSVFMNYLRGDTNRMVRMGPVPAVSDEEDFIPRIKPLRNIPEREVGLYCLLNDIPVHEDECPNAHDSLRFDVRDWLNTMEDKYPGIKFTALRAFDTMLPALQKEFTGEMPELRKCEKCGEPCSGDICKACRLEETI